MPGKIELVDVSFSYGILPVLRKVSLTVQRGDVVVIGGRSGHGKTTLLEIAVGLKKPENGAVFWDGKDIGSFTWSELLKARTKIGFMFQQQALISNFTVFENIALPLRVHSGLDEQALRFKVRTQMEEVGLFNMDSAFPEVLSQGQLKSVALARALINDPEMLLLDEPFNGIDPVTARGIINVLHSRYETNRTSIIMIAHKLTVWEDPVGKRLLLESGKLYNADEGCSGEKEYLDHALRGAFR
jgi:phospholipid/cholesterol/gamma-HCH transport system ATP-binding protein